MTEAFPVSHDDSPVRAPATTQKVIFGMRSPRLWIVVLLLLALAAGAQLIGPAVIPVGAAAITILPMVWGLIAGGVVSSQKWKPLGLDLQAAASAIMGLAVLLLCARLSFTIGPNIQLLFDAGPALLLQELGHLFGTIALALPLAVLLRMGPATVGATFSIDREGSFAMVSERYGPDSDQYRGVLSMYVFGTLFGAVLISLIASLATSFNIFDPLALAMGAGVGSGSMMAAAAASVVSAHPEMADQVLAVAATSNIITGLLGVYVGMYVALPLADRIYGVLTKRSKVTTEQKARTAPRAVAPSVTVPLATVIPILFVGGVIVSSIAAGGMSRSIIVGYLILTGLLLLGVGVARLTRGKIAAMIAIITIGALATTPWSPIGDFVSSTVGTVDFLSICTLTLTVAGLSLGKDLPLLKTIGWKIVPVGIVAILASYLLSVVVAEFALGLWH
ncbi:DUF3100 domain-containing protein [Rhodococcus sp. NPDC059969]|uniref:DUF3100 domain-containing protein n=1 Tax=Rhodococcus sp. NPDC059969 TaxID=3347018 RepID=UPI00366B9AC1